MVELFPLEQLSKNLNKTIEGQRENQLYWLNILNTKQTVKQKLKKGKCMHKKFV